MDEVKIITNNQWRPILRGDELTDKEKKEFDYINWDDFDEVMNQDFFRYKGEVYHLQEFMSALYFRKEWDGIQSDSFFSGILVRYDKEFENVQVGRYYG
jgi:hypothetical protein